MRPILPGTGRLGGEGLAGEEDKAEDAGGEEPDQEGVAFSIGQESGDGRDDDPH